MSCDYQSASLQPYYYNPEEKEYYFILGSQKRIESGKIQWSGFGGRVKEADKKDPLETALRELREEMINSLSDLEESIKSNLTEIIENDLIPKFIVNRFKKCPHIHYSVELSPTGTKINQFLKKKIFGLRDEHFQLLQQEGLKKCQKEKIELAWIKISDIQKRKLSGFAAQESDCFPYTLYEKPCKNSKIVTKEAHFRECMVVTLKSLIRERPEGFEYFYPDEKDIGQTPAINSPALKPWQQQGVHTYKPESRFDSSWEPKPINKPESRFDSSWGPKTINKPESRFDSSWGPKTIKRNGR